MMRNRKTKPPPPPAAPLPPVIAGWFAARRWTPHAHQLALLEAARHGKSVLLTAPTGGGKTLAGFLPSLVELAAAPHGPDCTRSISRR